MNMRRLKVHRGLLLCLYLGLLALGAKFMFSGFSALPPPDPERDVESMEAGKQSPPAPRQLSPIHVPARQSPLPQPPQVKGAEAAKDIAAGEEAAVKVDQTTKRPAEKPRITKSVVNIEENPEKKATLAQIPPIPGYPELVGGKFVPPRRVVHLDLKGAPMRPAFFAQLFPLLKQLGATGILMEWEEMFPFRGRLEVARNGFAYSLEDVKGILGAAKEQGLEVIPLVQTFGHLEWILKLPEFAHLRENPRYPQVACVGKAEAWSLIREAIAQVIQVHAEIAPVNFFHIGADEAFQVGHCPEDRALMAEHRGKQRFILWHIARTAQFIQDRFGSRVLAWHDMFHTSPAADLKSYNMLELIEPVNWNYAEDLNHYMPRNIWPALSAFPFVWGASAFKGADGPARYYANIPHYFANHRSWIGEMDKARQRVREFRGMILTGWSRYDHLSLLAELFPVGFPSLAVNLAFLKQGGKEDWGPLQKIVGCNLTPTPSAVTGCKFPGAQIYELVMQLKEKLSHLHSGLYQEHEFQGWLGRTAVAQNTSSAWYLEKVVPKVKAEHATLQVIHRQLKGAMDAVFFPDTVTEWLHEFAEEDLDKLSGLLATADGVQRMPTFPKRPHPVLPQKDIDA